MNHFVTWLDPHPHCDIPGHHQARPYISSSDTDITVGRKQYLADCQDADDGQWWSTVGQEQEFSTSMDCENQS